MVNKFFWALSGLIISISASAAGPKCVDLFSPTGAAAAVQSVAATSTFPIKLQSVDGQFTINTAAGPKVIEGKLNDLVQNNPELKSVLDSGQNTVYRILGSFKYKTGYQNHTLRLVSLNITNSNRAYNHQEAVAFINVNPVLANKLGLFKVEGYENIILIPDMVTLNERLSLVAKEYGSGEPIWSYAQANGVLAFEPYIKMLSQGKFPFSTDADVNLFVHDTMHAVSFTALNSTPAARRIAEIAKKRTQVLFKVTERLRTELNFTWIEGVAKKVATDPMERTMLLTILMTGNHKYFSPSVARAEGQLYKQQDKEITIERVKNVLRLLTQGAKDFRGMYDEVSQNFAYQNGVGETKAKLLKIFKEETADLPWPTDAEIQAAAVDIVKNFFADKIFADTPGVSKNTSTETVLGIFDYSDFSSQERPLPDSL